MAHGLTVISSEHSAAAEVKHQLQTFLGDLVSIRTYAYEQLRNLPPIQDDVVLISSPFLADRILPHLRPGCKYVLCQRSLAPQFLNRLLEIPKGSEVLVVNGFITSAYELIFELLELDLQFLKYFPYDPLDPAPPYSLGPAPTLYYSTEMVELFEPRLIREYEARYPRPGYSGRPFRYAITAGESDRVPEGIGHIIDLNQRQISLMTIAELLFVLTGNASGHNAIVSRHHKGVVKAYMELHKEYHLLRTLERQYRELIDHTDRGLIVYDDQKLVTAANALASAYTGCREMVGRRIEEVLPESAGRNFVTIRHQEYYLNKTPLTSFQNRSYHLVSLDSVKQIRSIDQAYRKQQKIAGSPAKYLLSDLVWESPEMGRTVERARRFAATDSTILITGESGTGKELLAQAIHNASARHSAPFVAINCTALPEALLESELFGYEDGAFTGARKGGKKGLMELAHGGTLFLDEIGDAPATIQAKLLRALQEREILRIGGEQAISVDLRVIAATNRNLGKLVRENRFRQDLYYRLKVLPITIAPLRARKEDISPLFHHFLGRAPGSLPEEVEAFLLAQVWPGNVRELENAAEYLRGLAVSGEEMLAELRELMPAGLPHRSSGESGKAPRRGRPLFPDAPTREHCLTILKKLSALNRKDISFVSQKKLIELLSAEGLALSPQQMKTRVRLLEKQKLVESRVGSGTRITSAGLEYLGEGRRSGEAEVFQ